MMQIENKVFLVTGGASGLGAATAEMLVAAGAKVMLVDMNAEAVAAQAQRLGAQSVVADISNEAAAEAAVQATVKALAASMAWSTAPASCAARRSSARTARTRCPASAR
jgi:NAD(P)-dependent dehydrogenase (short-subunit alcohol dehydrogenase family)